jgi:hypothetical protein
LQSLCCTGCVSLPLFPGFARFDLKVGDLAWVDP